MASLSVLTEATLIRIDGDFRNFSKFEAEAKAKVKALDSEMVKNGFRPVKSTAELQQVKGLLWGHNDHAANTERLHAHFSNDGNHDQLAWGSWDGRVLDIEYKDESRGKYASAAQFGHSMGLRKDAPGLVLFRAKAFWINDEKKLKSKTLFSRSFV